MIYHFISKTWTGWVDSNIYLIRNGVIQVEYTIDAYHYETNGNITTKLTPVTSGNKLIIFNNQRMYWYGKYQAYNECMINFTFKNAAPPTSMTCDYNLYMPVNGTTCSQNYTVWYHREIPSINSSIDVLSTSKKFKTDTGIQNITSSSSGAMTFNAMTSSSSTTYRYINKIRYQVQGEKSSNGSSSGDSDDRYITFSINNLWVTL